MRTSRSIAGVATATLLLAGLGVAGATSASAQDDGPLQVGHIYLFNNHKNLATATPALADDAPCTSNTLLACGVESAPAGAPAAAPAQSDEVVTTSSAPAMSIPRPAVTDRGVVVVYRGRGDGEIRDTRIVRFDGERWTPPRDVHTDGWKIAERVISPLTTTSEA